MISGKDLKRAIKAEGLTIEEAATKIGMTRVNLYSYLNRAELEEEFVENVNTKLNIKLEGKGAPYPTNNSQNDTHTQELIDQLKKSLSEKDGIIKDLFDEIKQIKAGIEDLKSVKELAEKNQTILQTVQKDLQTTIDWSVAFRNVAVAYLTDNPHQARSLSKTVSKEFSQVHSGRT